MSVRPAAAPVLPSPAEMERMVAQAGLTLNAGQMADLALGWRQIIGLVARIPRNRALLDDQAYVFALPPPVAPEARAQEAPKARAAVAKAGKDKAGTGKAGTGKALGSRASGSAPVGAGSARARPTGKRA